MFLSMQSLNGDSYQGAQVGANVQSQVGPTIKGSSWLGKKRTQQRREPSLSCLCTEPSTVQSEAPKAKKYKQKTRPKEKKKKNQIMTRNTYRWLTDSVASFALDGIFWQPKYIPSPLLSRHRTIQSWGGKYVQKHLALTWTLGLVLFCFVFYYYL